MRESPDAVDPGRMRGLVEFKNVSFSYDGKRPAVLDLTFTALPGETVALVGGTGAGKSTALALLHRAFDPQTGMIEIDGVNIRDIKLAALRRNIGVVYQESLLLNRSVAEHLRVGKADATGRKCAMPPNAPRRSTSSACARHVQHAGRRARPLAVRRRAPRLSIARAILKDPPILILDEATSALDAETERKVQAALDEVMKNRTTFVIAHRLSPCATPPASSCSSTAASSRPARSRSWSAWAGASRRSPRRSS